MFFKKKSKPAKEAENKPTRIIIFITLLLIFARVYKDKDKFQNTPSNDATLAMIGANRGDTLISPTVEVETPEHPEKDASAFGRIKITAQKNGKPITNFRDDNNNHFSGTLDADDIRLLAASGAEIIIRLNGDGDDMGAMSIEDEAALCAKLGIRFYYFNVERQFAEIAELVYNLMRNGNAVVHCLNGVHRAPMLYGYYIRKISNWVTDEEIIEILGWEELVRNPKEYEKYVDFLF